MRGEKGRLGRYEYAEEVSGRLRYLSAYCNHLFERHTLKSETAE